MVRPRLKSLAIKTVLMVFAIHFSALANSSYQLNVTGRGILYNSILSPASLELLPLSGLYVGTEFNNYPWTDIFGKFLIPNQAETINLNLGLVGRWVKVVPKQGVALEVSGVLDPNNTELNLQFNSVGNDEFATAQINAFYHINIAHDWAKAHGLNHPDVDQPITAEVNVPGACNATLSSNRLIFFQSGQTVESDGSISKCPNMAFDSVIYHEYGHFLDRIYGRGGDRGLSEGWGDVIAMFISGKPEVNQGFDMPASMVRSGDNQYQFPKDPKREPSHQLGQAWSGFVWDLRTALIQNLGLSGAEICIGLVLPALVSNELDIPAAVRKVWSIGKNDYAPEITKAAKAHSLDQFLN
jgi:hypothetical protein